MSKSYTVITLIPNLVRYFGSAIEPSRKKKRGESRCWGRAPARFSSGAGNGATGWPER